MNSAAITTLLHRYPIISDQVDSDELRAILTVLSGSLEKYPAGAVVEFGCYIGTTSLFIRRLMEVYQAAGEFHVYDSFAGLPEKSDADRSPAGDQFRTGELAVTKKDFTVQFKKAGLRLPTIHKAWFHELTHIDVPDGISCAFLDGDYYESIRNSLRLITPKLLSGAAIIVDDYTSEALPGAARAVDEWRRSHRASLRVQSSLAIMQLE